MIATSILNNLHIQLTMQFNFKIDNNWATPIDAPLWIHTDAIKFDTNFTSFLFPDESTENLAQELRKEQAIYLRNAALHHCRP